jgi:hypothetical protein
VKYIEIHKHSLIYFLSIFIHVHKVIAQGEVSCFVLSEEDWRMLHEEQEEEDIHIDHNDHESVHRHVVKYKHIFIYKWEKSEVHKGLIFVEIELRLLFYF